MRPRVFPAEDPAQREEGPHRLRCFNEAAGIPRGRHENELQAAAAIGQASMRPRVFPAEDAGATTASSRPRCGFNEAAGIPRGRRTARNPLRSKEVRHWIARGRAIANDERPLTPWG